MHIAILTRRASLALLIAMGLAGSQAWGDTSSEAVPVADDGVQRDHPGRR
ncbi:hypothetical protein [Billgrantia zhangzhouensis]|nr:hypothetical protein [Halomonas zhangzhouensis]